MIGYSLPQNVSQKLQQILPAAIFFSFIYGYFCCFLDLTNLTALWFLFVACLLSYFTPKKVGFSRFHLLFFGFVLFSLLHHNLIYPELSSSTFVRKTLFALTAGMAVCYAMRSTRMHWIYLLNFILVLSCYITIPACIFGLLDPSMLYDHTGRLKLLLKSANRLSSVSGLCCLCGVIYLCSPKLPKVFFFHPESRFRLNRYTYYFLSSKTIVFLFMVQSGVILLLSLTRTGLFAFAIVATPILLAYLIKCNGLLKTLLYSFVASLFVLLSWSYAPIPQNIREEFNSRIISAVSAPWQVSTFTSRIPLWKSGINAFSQKPLLGHGLWGFEEQHVEFVKSNYDALVDQYGEEIVQGDTIKARSTHNLFLEFFVFYGIPGGLLFASLFALPIIWGVFNRTGMGEAIPVLCYYSIIFFFESVIKSNIELATTIIFMTLGYFASACALRKEFELRKNTP